jgi:hypothetical protein
LPGTFSPPRDGTPVLCSFRHTPGGRRPGRAAGR